MKKRLTDKKLKEMEPHLFFFFFLTIESKISLIQNGNTFTSEHGNQTA